MISAITKEIQVRKENREIGLHSKGSVGEIMRQGGENRSSSLFMVHKIQHSSVNSRVHTGWPKKKFTLV